MGVTGSITGCSLNGVNYGVMADADASIPSDILVEGVATSGNNIMKRTKQVAMISGLVLDVSNGLDAANLETLMQSTAIYSMSFTLADGSVYSQQGMINKSTVTTQDGAAAVDLIPRAAWNFQPA